MISVNKEIKLKRKRILRGIVTTLAAIVVFVTTYALIIPAVTWERIGALLMLGALTIGHILWRRREGRGEE